MTIPDDVIRRAAEAICGEASFSMGWEDLPEWRRAIYRNQARAAYTILRDAIRKELVQEMIAELEGDRELVYPGAETNDVINDIVIWWLEGKLS